MANRSVQIRDLDKFIEIIVKSGFSYRRLAKEAKIDQTTISLLTKGERNPSPKTAVNICRALGCQFDDIFFVTTNDKSH